MTRKLYIKPEFDKLDVEISNLLAGSPTSTEPKDEDEIGEGDAVAKEWGTGFFDGDE